jgi:hypothetical protein
VIFRRCAPSLDLLLGSTRTFTRDILQACPFRLATSSFSQLGGHPRCFLRVEHGPDLAYICLVLIACAEVWLWQEARSRECRIGAPSWCAGACAAEADASGLYAGQSDEQECGCGNTEETACDGCSHLDGVALAFEVGCIDLGLLLLFLPHFCCADSVDCATSGEWGWRALPDRGAAGESKSSKGRFETCLRTHGRKTLLLSLRDRRRRRLSRQVLGSLWAWFSGVHYNMQWPPAEGERGLFVHRRTVVRCGPRQRRTDEQRCSEHFSEGSSPTPTQRTDCVLRISFAGLHVCCHACRKKELHEPRQPVLE